jgi:hypothetical protein
MSGKHAPLGQTPILAGKTGGAYWNACRDKQRHRRKEQARYHPRVGAKYLDRQENAQPRVVVFQPCCIPSQGCVDVAQSAMEFGSPMLMLIKRVSASPLAHYGEALGTHVRAVWFICQRAQKVSR